jgi:pyrroloquinoline quinone (PQQ) biosynthesis protein C
MLLGLQEKTYLLKISKDQILYILSTSGDILWTFLNSFVTVAGCTKS